MNNILPLVLLGAAAYFLLNKQTTASSAPVTTSPTTPTPPPPTAPTGASMLAKLTATVQAAPDAKQQGGDYVGTPWQFNYWLNHAVGIDLAPNMGQIFPGCGTGIAGGCDDTPITLTQFWSLAAPWLKGQGSLSGIGSFPHFLGGNRVRTPHRVLAGWR